MKELEQAITDAFAGLVERGELKQIIDKNVKECTERVMRDAFSYNSGFEKALRDHLNANLKIDLSSVGLAEYNATLLGIVKAKLDANISRFADKQFKEQLEELLQSPPLEVKLSEVIEQYRDYVKKDTGEGYFNGTVLVEQDGSFTHVALAAKPGVERFSCDVRFDVHRDRVYSIDLKYHRNITEGLFCGQFYGFERTLFQMWAARTKVNVDAEYLEAAA
jgi:hypothetical protein